MSYITADDLRLWLGDDAYTQLTDDDGTGLPNEQIVQQALTAAQGEVDSYLARRYRLPLDSVRFPKAVETLAVITLDVAEYRLNTRRPPIPEEIQLRYRHALSWLTQLARGELLLPAESAIPATAATGLQAATFGNPLVLDHQEMNEL